MSVNSAMEAAHALAATPSLVHAMRQQPLPDGVTSLLKLLASAPGDLTQTSDAFGTRDAQHLRTVAEAYVQRVMLFSGASPHRVLGVPPGASRAEMRANLRWLMTWLHPDKNSAEWRSVFASRVLDAWRSLGSMDKGGDQELGLDIAPIMPMQPEPLNQPFRETPPWVRKTPAAHKRSDRSDRNGARRRASVSTFWPRTRLRRFGLLLLVFVLLIPSAYLLAAEVVTP